MTGAEDLHKHRWVKGRLLSFQCVSLFILHVTWPKLSSLSFYLRNLHKKSLVMGWRFPQRLNVTGQIADLSEVLFVLQVGPHYKHLPDQSIRKGLTTSNVGYFLPHSTRLADHHDNAYNHLIHALHMCPSFQVARRMWTYLFPRTGNESMINCHRYFLNDTRPHEPPRYLLPTSTPSRTTLDEFKTDFCNKRIFLFFIYIMTEDYL